MSKFIGIVAGAAMVGAGLFLEFVTLGASTPLTVFLISAGIGMVISGIGTLLSKGPLAGTSTASRNPIAPWVVVYGRAKVAGTLVYFSEFGDNNKYLDMVFALACHPCQSFDALLFDGQRIQISTNKGSFNGVSGDSFSPVQQNLPISHISRANNVVTVVLLQDIPLLQAGDNVIIQNVSGDYTLNGRFPVEQIISQVYAPGTPGSVTFTYLCGGPPAIVDNEGQCLTTWPNYGAKVHVEVLLGAQTATFPGMLNGTPSDGDSGNLISPEGTYGTANQWTASCVGSGRTMVFIRLHYNDQYFASGLPNISFLIHGKNDIVDPRSSPATVGYTENPCLCIADYLCNVAFGFKASWGTEVPLPQLIAAANICDERVPLASGATEVRYALNGAFPLTMRRGLVLQNLLTSCCGRLIFIAGQFVIQPAGWPGVALVIPPPPAAGAAPVFASATLTVILGHIPGDTYQAYGGAYVGAIGDFAFNAPLVFDNSAFAERAYIFDCDEPTMNALVGGTLHLQFDDEGTIFGDATLPGDQFLVYDAYVNATLTDGTIQVWRPEGTNVIPSETVGQVLNQQTPTRQTTGRIPQVIITGLDGLYDIYVYSDGANGPIPGVLYIGGGGSAVPPAPRAAVYQLFGPGISGPGLATVAAKVITAVNAPFDGTFIQANAPGSFGTGNYLLFAGIRVPSALKLTCTPGTQSTDHARAPLNGMQLVPVGGGPAISINFVGAGDDFGMVQMAATESAGVIARTNWNNAPSNIAGYQGIPPIALLDETGAATGAELYYVAETIGLTGIPNTPGNNRMMGGFVDKTDPTGYATIQRHHFSSLGSSPVLQLTSWSLLVSYGWPVLGENPAAASAQYLGMAAGPFRWRSKLSIRDLYNGCKGTFISPGNKWQSSDFPPYAQDTDHGYASGSPLFPFGDANLAEDGGDRRWLDIQLPFTISVTMAQRLAKIELMRRRQQGTGTFVYNMALYNAVVLDIVQMTLPYLGWVNKLLEISAFRFTLDKINSGGKEVVQLGTQIDVQETDPSVYAWAITEELSPEGYQQANLPANTGATGSGTLGDIYTVNGT